MSLDLSDNSLFSTPPSTTNSAMADLLPDSPEDLRDVLSDASDHLHRLGDLLDKASRAVDDHFVD